MDDVSSQPRVMVQNPLDGSRQIYVGPLPLDVQEGVEKGVLFVQNLDPVSPHIESVYDEDQRGS